MKTRKLVLLACTAFLLVVCIVQGILNNISPVKTFRMEGNPDKITVSSSIENVEMVLNGTDWLLSGTDFNADKGSVNAMIASLRELRQLGAVARFSDDESNAKYGLDDSKAITVTAYKNGKSIASLRIGSASSTGAQTYACVNGSSEIVMISGNILKTFGKTQEGLKSKLIFSILPEDVNSVRISADKSFGFERTTGTDGSSQWKFTNDSKETDSEKITEWLSDATVCSASSWLPDTQPLPSNKSVDVEFDTKNGKVTLNVYRMNDGEKNRFIAVSGNVKHRFELSESTVNRYKKSVSDFAK